VYRGLQRAGHSGGDSRSDCGDEGEVANMIEIWRDVKGYEGLYQVSNMGRVISNNGLLHLNTNTYGYKHITLSKGNVQKTVVVHKLVADAFIENPHNKPQINHIDGNKENNAVANLEWVTQGDNNRHAIRMNLRKAKKILLVDDEGNAIKEFNNRMEISAYLGRKVCQDLITRCCNGQRKTAYGFVWRYAE
jgi:hypothetical protein